MHTRKVSAVKSVSWRLIGIAMLASIVWLYTHEYITAGIITAVHHVSFIIIYYLHERFWEGRDLRGKPFLKAFIYEIVLGFLVLGVITFVVTGSWTEVTLISATYLSLRFILYPAHERFYARINR